MNWRFARPASDLNRSGGPNWRTDAAVAPGGYFDDLASHGLDLITFLIGEVSSAAGVSTNQQGLYSVKDAVSGSWQHRCGATGSGSWTFGAGERSDRLEILGSEGAISFSVFGEVPLELSSRTRTEEVFVKNPQHVQLPHVGNMQRHLAGELQHPSTGASATHTAWVMAQLLG